MPQSRLLQVTDLSVDIRLRHSTVHAVDKLTVGIDAGQTLGLVGESGCGKSTLGMSLLGLLPPGGHITHGSITLDGNELAGVGERSLRRVRGARIGVVFQDPMTALDPTKAIGAQVAEPLRIHSSQSRAATLRRAEEMLALVGLPRPADQMGKYPHELSGGMRQRVVIAIALICEPSLLIADEPTTALDVTTQDQIMALFGDLRHQMGMAVLLITHDMGVIARRADRVAVMYAGQIIEEGDVDEIFYDYRHRYTEALLRSIPTLDTPKDKSLSAIPGIPPPLTAPPPGCRFAARCSYATDECRAAVPAMVHEELHRYACIHPTPGQPPQCDDLAPDREQAS